MAVKTVKKLSRMKMRKRKVPGSSRLAPEHVRDMRGLDEGRVQRLLEAGEASRRKMQPFREQRLALIQKFVAHYGESGAEKATPMNLIRMAVTIYRRLIAARAPRAMVTPLYDISLRPMADTVRLALNHTLRRIRFDEALDEWVMGAMFSLGVGKSGISGGGELVKGSDGMAHDSGLCFFEPVDFDDYVCDMRAMRAPLMQFEGDRSEVPIEAMEDAGIEDVTPVRAQDINDGGDLRVSSLSTAGEWSEERGYIDIARVWEMFLPFEQMMVLIESDDEGAIDTGRVIRVTEWEGRAQGPYHKLFFEKPPGNILPVPPSAQVSDLHDSTNKSLRKLDRQAARSKEITAFAGAGKKDAQRIRDGGDGDMVQVESPERIKQLRFGGPDAHLLAYLLTTKDLASWVCGNLDALGGLQRQSNTVGQDSMIVRAANMMIEDMQDRVNNACRGVFEDMATMIVGDPAGTMRLMKMIPNTGDELGIPIVFGPEQRKQLDIGDFGLQVTPFSMQSRTPRERIQTMSEIMTNFGLPLQGALQSLGYTVDVPRFFEFLADYSDTPEARQLVRLMTPQEQMAYMQQGQGAGGERPLQSPVTTRTNVRRNEGGGRNEANEAVKALLAAPQGGSGGDA